MASGRPTHADAARWSRLRDHVTNANVLNPGDRAGPYDLVIGAKSAAAFGRATCLQRLAVRFASPGFLDRDLAVRIYTLGGDRDAMEAMCGEDTVIRNGLADLRASAAM